MGSSPLAYNCLFETKLLKLNTKSLVNQKKTKEKKHKLQIYS